MTLRFLLLFIMTCGAAKAQAFFVNSLIEFPIENKMYAANIGNNNLTPLYVCPATNNNIQSPEQQYLDIAINSSGELFYISGGGSLYKRQQNDDNSCQFLGSFETTTNALVSDSNTILYAAANLNGVCTLYKYDASTGIFSNLGDLPAGYFSAGDLFFYQNQLFLTASNSDFTSSFLVSINLQQPTESCFFMDFGNLTPYGAFSLGNEISSTAYILSGPDPNSATLIEIDMSTATIGNVIQNFDFPVLGAASVYSVTSNSTGCAPMGINDGASAYMDLNVQNPASGTLLFSHDLDKSQITAIKIFDESGKLVKNYKQSFTNDIDISDIADGMYLLQTSILANSFTQKLIIKN